MSVDNRIEAPEVIYDRDTKGDDLYVLLDRDGDTLKYLGFRLAEEAGQVHFSKELQEFVFRSVFEEGKLYEPGFHKTYEWDRETVLQALMERKPMQAFFTPEVIRRAYQQWDENKQAWCPQPRITLTDTGDGFDVQYTHIYDRGTDPDRLVTDEI